ncbi:MAG: helix-turn-helix transcriptional regulator [Arcanobacterium sp.]|nr:helix-turn-helix transcriptional regulator [Arcanobacterium sp.]
MSTPSAAELLLSQELARHIKGRRLALKKTQEQVANEAGIDRNHYQNIESGRSDRRSQNPLNPQLFTIARLATALECTISELLASPGEKYSAAVERFEWR